MHQFAGETVLEQIKLEDSCLPNREIPKGAEEPTVYRCSDRRPKGGAVIEGCGFEWRNVTFVFETDAWCGYASSALFDHCH